MAENKSLTPHSKSDLLTGKPKNVTTDPAPTNPGAVHVAAPGLLAKGLSRTQSARLLGADQIGEVHGGGQTTTVNLKAGHKPGNVPDKE